MTNPDLAAFSDLARTWLRVDVERTQGEWRVDPAYNCDVQAIDGPEICSTHPGLISGRDGRQSKPDAAFIAANTDPRMRELMRVLAGLGA